MKRFLLSFAILMATVSAMAQDTLRVVTLNVNGLPEIAGGTADNGKTKLMSQYLAKKGYDIIAAQEDFNYHNDLTSALSEDYQQAKHSGGLNIFNLLTRTNTDGLMLFWKKDLPVTGDVRTAWKNINGNGLVDGDDRVTKGYRFYEATVGNDIVVDIYTLHMDAGSLPEDIAARESQIQQLYDAIVQADASHPKIIMGDTNCRYTREQLKKLLIDSLNNSDKYSCTDAWVEFCKGDYPEYGTAPLMVDSLGVIEGEVVDKIIYINPRHGNHLVLKDFALVDDFVNEKGEMLSDHRPMEATFEVEKGIVIPATTTGWFEGEDFVNNEESWYIYNIGTSKFVGDDGKLYANINESTPWGIWGSENPFSISKTDGDRFYMDGWPGYGTGVRGSSATSFHIVKEGSTEGSYNLAVKFTLGGWRYFNVTNGENSTYSAASTNGPMNDWLFISTAQKDVFNEYVDLHQQALDCINLPMDDDIKSSLADILNKAANTTYSQCIGENGIIAQLKFILAIFKEQLEGVESISAGRNIIPVSFYSLHGQRNNGMQKGVNIVKMSDGTTRKVIKK